MTRRQVWRYKCDFCPKSNCSASSITRHEKACHRNPNRYCDLCDTQWPMVDPDPVDLIRLAEPLPDWNEFNGEPVPQPLQDCLDALKQVTAGCPLCIIAAIAQSGTRVMFPYDVAKELQAYKESL